jgi:hypothetical protein
MCVCACQYIHIHIHIRTDTDTHTHTYAATNISSISLPVHVCMHGHALSALLWWSLQPQATKCIILGFMCNNEEQNWLH